MKGVGVLDVKCLLFGWRTDQSFQWTQPVAE